MYHLVQPELVRRVCQLVIDSTPAFDCYPMWSLAAFVSLVDQECDGCARIAAAEYADNYVICKHFDYVDNYIEHWRWLTQRIGKQVPAGVGKRNVDAIHQRVDPSSLQISDSSIVIFIYLRFFFRPLGAVPKVDMEQLLFVICNVAPKVVDRNRSLL